MHSRNIFNLHGSEEEVGSIPWYTTPNNSEDMGKPGKCKCDFTEKLNCHHTHKYSILNQNFPDHGLVSIENLMDTLDSINNQTCGCEQPCRPSNAWTLQIHQGANSNISAVTTDALRPGPYPFKTRNSRALCQSHIILDLCQTVPVFNTIYRSNHEPRNLDLPTREWIGNFLHPERQFLENKLLSAMEF